MYFQLFFVAILSTCAAAVAAKSNLQGKRNPATSTSTLSITGTVPIPLYDLPTLVPGSSFQADPYDVEAIRNTMSHYPLAIDGKNFAALSLVFAPDAVANYTAPLGVLTPLSTIEAALGASLAPVTTQHFLGTQVIDILSPTTAFSLTYFIATHFGVGIYYGETATAHGQYQDVWTRQADLSWRISHRSFAYMVC
jgi:ketosteroid isomerase-like protein